jgi:hypothetical protein
MQAIYRKNAPNEMTPKQKQKEKMLKTAEIECTIKRMPPKIDSNHSPYARQNHPSLYTAKNQAVTHTIP